MKSKAPYLTKNLAIPLNKEAEVTDDGFLLKRGIFTSDATDEVGDIITRSATERAVPKYRQWGNIRYMHQPKPVALVQRIGAEDGLEWNEVEIKIIDPNARFEVEQGLLKALSVGIYIKNFDDVTFTEDGGLIINDYSLAEISLVDHPANYDAVLKSAGMEMPWKDAVKQHGAPSLAKALGLSQEEDMNKVKEEQALPVETEVEETTEEAPVAEEVNKEMPVEEAPAEFATDIAEEENVAEEVDENEEQPIEENDDVEAAEEEELPEEKDLDENLIEAIVARVTERVLEGIKSLIDLPRSEVSEAAAQDEEPVETDSTEDAQEDDLMLRLSGLEAQVSELLSTAPRKASVEQPLPQAEETVAPPEPEDLIKRAKGKTTGQNIKIIPRK